MTWEEAVQRLKADPTHAELVRSCYYDDPLLAAARRFHESSEWQATQALLRRHPRGKALELGAGRGIASYALARDGWETTALEPDKSPLVGAEAIRGLASEAGLAIQVCLAHGERLPFAAESFDLVYGRAVLHHARDLAALCREAARVLRPGGVFLAVREHVISKPEHLATFLESHPLHRHYGGENAFLLRDYVRAIESAGIRLQRVFNPLASPINMFPASPEDVRNELARRLHLPRLPVPNVALRLLGRLLQSPGRLYSFLGSKAGG